MLLLLSGLLLAAVSFTQLFAHQKIRPNDSPSRWLVQKLNPTLLALAVVFCLTGAPFYIRFILSKSSLDAYVTDLGAHTNSQTDKRVGLFLVREIDTRNETIRLITCDDGMADHARLVFSPHGKPERVGEDIYTHISGPWWHWQRSW